MQTDNIVVIDDDIAIPMNKLLGIKKVKTEQWGKVDYSIVFILECMNAIHYGCACEMHMNNVFNEAVREWKGETA